MSNVFTKYVKTSFQHFFEGCQETGIFLFKNYAVLRTIHWTIRKYRFGTITFFTDDGLEIFQRIASGRIVNSTIRLIWTMTNSSDENKIKLADSARHERIKNET